MNAAPLAPAGDRAVLDDAYIGDIHGALGTIRLGDRSAVRRRPSRRLATLLAILGPGLIVMVGDNDAGAFGTYTQAGQNYGTRLLWTLVLLVPVLYVNQEMVVRLGAVTGLGHARLILERFGRFWGAFSVIDLFVLNALTVITEFIGITLAGRALDLPKGPTVVLGAVIVVGAASTGSLRRFERLCLGLVAGSLVLIPVYVLVHPPAAAMVHGVLVPGFPAGANASAVMLLVIAIVGTTIAPWQLFFQQSYVIDKRITPRFIRYEKADLWIGIMLVIAGAAAMMGFSAAAFTGRPGFGHFTDAAGVSAGLAHTGGRLAGTLFAIGLLDASIIGAAAVGLATAYATSDVLGVNHSLHRSVGQAKTFYACYGALMALAVVLVLIPGVPLGTLTEGVQCLAGVLLPSATVFLLLLCNDRDVLGPWVNGRWRNVFTGVVVWSLVMLSVLLTAGILFPHIRFTAIVAILAGGLVLGVVIGAYLLLRGWLFRREALAERMLGVPRGGRLELPPRPRVGSEERAQWRMPPLAALAPPMLSVRRKVGLLTLRGYLVLAVALVVVKLVSISLG